MKILFLLSVVFTLFLVFVLDLGMPSYLTVPIGIIGGIFYLVCLAKDNKFYVLAIILLYLPMAKLSPFVLTKGLNMTNILVLSFFVRYVVLNSHRGQKGDSRMHKVVCLIILFMVISFIQGLMRPYSPPGDELLTALVELTIPWLFYLAMTACLSSIDDIRHALMFSCVGYMISSLSGYMEFREKRWRSSIDKSRVMGPLMQPNTYGAFIAYVVPVILAFFLYYPARFRIVLGILAMMSIRVLLATFSRGGYLALGSATLTQFFFKGRIFFIGTLLLGAVALVLFPDIMPESVRIRLIGHTFRGGDVQFDNLDNVDTSGTNRLVLWQAAGEMIKESPIYGKGLLSFPNIVDNYLTRPVPERDTHNMFLKIMVYMGIPALVAYLYFFWLVLRNSYVILKTSTNPLFQSVALGGIGSCVSLFVSCMFGSRMENLEFLCYFLTLSAIISFLSCRREIIA